MENHEHFSSAQRISAEDLRADVGGITFPVALHYAGRAGKADAEAYFAIMP